MQRGGYGFNGTAPVKVRKSGNASDFVIRRESFNGTAPVKVRKSSATSEIGGSVASFNGTAPVKVRKFLDRVHLECSDVELQWDRTREGAEVGTIDTDGVPHSAASMGPHP